MWMSEDDRRRIAAKVAERFATFGGEKKSHWGNPIAEAMQGHEPVFAAGVDVREVVDLVINELPDQPSS